ncbi:MAG: type II toxin-antitoxin system MqsA family antitoxin [Gammaproteobacteria bacterium]|nr:type II toxin-antitoxin system MqsA family antitoxin [Gammaproteobacteria bacterium]
MKCVICKTGDTLAGEVTVTLQRGETTVIIKKVPAQVCDNCGEYYLSDDISERVLNQAEKAVNINTEIEILYFAA